jgi:hypothetical protein
MVYPGPTSRPHRSCCPSCSRDFPSPSPDAAKPVGGGRRRKSHRAVQHLSPLAPPERHVIYGAHRTFRTPALLWPPGRQIVASLQRLCSLHDLGPKSGREGRIDGRVARIVASLLGCGERGCRIRPATHHHSGNPFSVGLQRSVGGTAVNGNRFGWGTRRKVPLGQTACSMSPRGDRPIGVQG